jgi:hypothetical protein
MSFSETVDLNLGIKDDFTARYLFPEDRLLRLHPNWFIEEFQERENGQFSARLKDYVTDSPFDLKGMVAYHMPGAEGQNALIHISLVQGLEMDILFFINEKSLHVRVDAQKAIEADDPVLLWIRAIREYLRIHLRKTPVTLFWRLVMNKAVLSMNPSQRKICLMMVRLTLVEILVIVLILVGYVIFVL